MKPLFNILSFAKSLWRYYVVIGVFTVLLSILTLLQPLFIGWVIDEIRKGTGTNMRYVLLLAVLIFVIDVAVTVFSNIGGYYGDQLSLKLNRLLSRRYFAHLLELPQSYYDTELTGTIINRLNRSINQITDFVQMMSNAFLQFLFSTVFMLVIVAYYSWPTALIMLTIYPIYIWLTTRSSAKWQAWQGEKNQALDLATGRFGEVINQVKVVKSFIGQRLELRHFDQQYKKALDVNKPQSKYWHTHDIYRRIVLGILFFLIYLYIFYEGARGRLTPGAVVTLVLYAMQIRIPIFTISMLVDRTQRAIADSKDYFEVMRLEPTITDKPAAPALRIKKGAITFRDVVFRYTSDKPVLKGVDLAIKPHTKVALVGESGEGKTTLTNLLLRLYQPTGGTIEIDGQNIMDVTQASLRRQIGVVFQEPALFSGTVRENIAYGRPEATDAEIIQAARDANAHEFIEKLEHGYDTTIGERGVRLSGGQKQRVAIARALLKNAPILILDEATSSLDSRSEQLVQEALERLMKSRTTLIIAHRLSTVQHVDQIVTLKDGRIDEIGSPKQLARTGGIYAQLLALQNQKPGDQRDTGLKAFDMAEK
ncbi:MAG TPA: ABC transporter ATP-binding protein [Candidatus Limnocylindrales bacterium]|nr:ABC transporter ATP-binding protein [Candidatus Limnocylindrales bacterium]